jgi:hypothetical protein
MLAQVERQREMQLKAAAAAKQQLLVAAAQAPW